MRLPDDVILIKLTYYYRDFLYLVFLVYLFLLSSMSLHDMFPDDVFSNEMVEAFFVNNFGDGFLKLERMSV
jgi:hypothetical protein